MKKPCSKCRELKPLTSFNKSRNYCKECQKEKDAHYRKDNPINPKAKSRSRTYSSWRCMKKRCYYIADNQYEHYGAKGITVSDRWINNYDNFLEDMGERPPDMTLDRIDNSKGYFPENCRWADNSTQSRNRSCVKLTKNDIPIIRKLLKVGRPLKEIGRYYGVHFSTIGYINTGKLWRDVA